MIVSVNQQRDRLQQQQHQQNEKDRELTIQSSQKKSVIYNRANTTPVGAIFESSFSSHSSQNEKSDPMRRKFTLLERPMKTLHEVVPTLSISSASEDAPSINNINNISGINYIRTEDQVVAPQRLTRLNNQRMPIQEVILPPTPPFILTYFGVKAPPPTFSELKQRRKQNQAASDLKSRCSKLPYKSSTNPFDNTLQSSRGVAPNLPTPTHSETCLSEVFSSKCKNSQREKDLDNESEESSPNINQSVVKFQWADVIRIVREGILNVWDEESDPNLYYFPTIKSHQDLDLLNHHIRRRKIMGLFLTLNIINFLNLIFPEMSTNSNAKTSDKSGEMSLKPGHSIFMQILQKSTFNFQMTLVNIFCTAVIFGISFYVCFCSQILRVKFNSNKITVLASIFTQYLFGILFIFWPNLFVFQFLTNMTVMFVLIAKEVVTSKKVLWVLLANTFAVNYFSMRGVRISANENLCQNEVPLTDIIGYEEYTRAHVFAIVGVVLQIFQIQSLNWNLVKMLVSRINSMQRTLDIKDTYNASMIHELRNPLNAVLGSIGLLKYSKSLSKEDMETLNIASVSGEILITLINNALDGAKLEANKLELDYRMNDSVEILSKSVSLFSWKAKQKKQSISLKIAKNMPDQVEIDEARLTQVLVNLVGNAVKFTPDSGNVKVRARFIPDQEENEKKHKDKEDQDHNVRRNSALSNEDEEDEHNYFNQDISLQGGEGSPPTWDDKEFEDKFFYTKEVGTDIPQVSDDNICGTAGMFEGGCRTPDMSTRHKKSYSFHAQYPIEATGGMDFNQESNNGDNSQHMSAHFFDEKAPLELGTMAEQAQHINMQRKASEHELSNSVSSLYNNADTSDDEEVTKTALQSAIDRDLVIKNSFNQWEKRNRLQTEGDFDLSSLQQQPDLSMGKFTDLRRHMTRDESAEKKLMLTGDEEEEKKEGLKSRYKDEGISIKGNSDEGNQLSFNGIGGDLSNDANLNLSNNYSPSVVSVDGNSVNIIAAAGQRKSIFFKSKFYKDSSQGINSSIQSSKKDQNIFNKQAGSQSGFTEHVIHSQLQIQRESAATNAAQETGKVIYQRQHSSRKSTALLANYRKIKNKSKGTLIIEVIDSGIGISNDGIQKLFKPFSQADKSIQTKYGGTGLGLWISHKLISLMRGKISVLSELNKGTVFIIEIPVNCECTQLVPITPLNGIQACDLQQQLTPLLDPDSLKSYGNQEGESQNSSAQVGKNGSRYHHLHGASQPRAAGGANGSHDDSKSESTSNNHNLGGMIKIASNFSGFNFGNLGKSKDGEEIVKVLLYQQDEIMKNLLKKYLQKHRIQYFCSSSFKDLLKMFKLREHAACFIDIDVNVKNEELEKLVAVNEKFRSEDTPFKCRIYCFYSRDIDRTKTRFLQRNHIHCLKKPIQGYQLSKYLRRLKNNDFEQQLLALKRGSIATRSHTPPDTNLLGVQQNINQPLHQHTLSPHGVDKNRIKKNSIDQNHNAFHRQQTGDMNLMMGADDLDDLQLIYRDLKQEQPLVNKSLMRLKFKQGSRSQAVENNDTQLQQDQMEQEEELMAKLEHIQVKNKHIERLKMQETFSADSYLQDSRKVLSVGEFGSSSELPIFQSQNNSFELGMLQNTLPIKSTSQRKEDDQLSHGTPSNKQQLLRQQRRFTLQVVSLNDNNNCAMEQQLSADQQQENRVIYEKDDYEEEKLELKNHGTPQFYQSQNTISMQGGNSSISLGQYYNPALVQTLKLPLIQHDSRSNSSGSLNNIRRKSKFGVKHLNSILIVDDNLMNIMILQKMIESLNMHNSLIMTAENGQQALDLYKAEARNGRSTTKLILMDCEMPIMNGFTSSQLIREFESENQINPPVLIIGLSGNSGGEFCRKCKSSGMDDTMIKPLPIDHIQRLLQRLRLCD